MYDEPSLSCNVIYTKYIHTLATKYWDFKVAIFFDIEYLRNNMRQSHSYCRTSVGSHMISIER